MLRQGSSLLWERERLLQRRQLLPRQGWQGLPDDVEGCGRKRDLLRRWQVLHDVEERQWLLWRQDV